MDINYIDRSPWYSVPLLVTWGWLVIGPLLALRARDPRLIAALPLIGNTATAAFLVWNLLRILDAVGYVPRTGGALAAGLAEALYPWCIGATVSATTSSVIGLFGAFTETRGRRTRLGTLALTFAAAAGTPTAAFLWHMRPSSRNYGPELITTATIPLALAVAGLIVAIVPLAAPKRGSYRVESGRRWFLAFAAVSALAACVLWCSSRD